MVKCNVSHFHFVAAYNFSTLASPKYCKDHHLEGMVRTNPPSNSASNITQFLKSSAQSPAVNNKPSSPKQQQQTLKMPVIAGMDTYESDGSQVSSVDSLVSSCESERSEPSDDCQVIGSSTDNQRLHQYVGDQLKYAKLHKNA